METMKEEVKRLAADNAQWQDDRALWAGERAALLGRQLIVVIEDRELKTLKQKPLLVDGKAQL